VCKARVVSKPQTDPNDADELWAGAAVLQHRVDLLEGAERLSPTVNSCLGLACAWGE